MNFNINSIESLGSKRKYKGNPNLNTNIKEFISLERNIRDILILYWPEYNSLDSKGNIKGNLQLNKKLIDFLRFERKYKGNLKSE